MGYGDHLMAIGAASRQFELDPLHRPVAIGDGRRVDPQHPELRRGLDFLATQDMVDDQRPVTWVISYRGHRPYHDHGAMRALWSRRHRWRSRLLGTPRDEALVDRLGRYVYDLGHRAVPAPLVLDADETAIAEHWSKRAFVLIEPNVKDEASPGKRWLPERYAEVARRLSRDVPVFQIGAEGSVGLDGIPRAPTRQFRDALPLLKAARLYIGPEGGLHHAAAAMGTPAVVLFGGFTPPSVTGYDFHVNLAGTAEACGTHPGRCAHCEAAMENIGVEEVLGHALRLLEPKAG